MARLLPEEPGTRTLFSTTPRSGARPNAGIIHDAAGALYGTTAFGGTHGLGTVFRLTRPTASNPHWIETVLHSFVGPDGGRPGGGLIFDTAGALYGTTIEGGRKDMGTVFRLAPPSGLNGNWTETVLHSFAGPDGLQPEAALLLDKSGALYGAASWGGAHEQEGVLFELTPAGPTNPAWSETLLHSFRANTEADGAHPVGSIVIDFSGALYGVTYVGWGRDGNEQIVTGKIYKLAPPTAGNPNSTLTILHAFSPDDGQRPLAGLISDGSGRLYGTTTDGGVHGGGTIFKLTPASMPRP